jgi:hypothetical protein
MGVNWDVLFLGKHKRYVKGEYINTLMVKTTEDWLDKPLYKRTDAEGIEFWGAHAYLVRRKTLKFLIDNYVPINMGVDVWLQYITKKGPLNILSLQETFVYQQSNLLMINMGTELSTHEMDNLTDSDTYQNHNRKGKFKWLQMPKFSISLNKGDYMWEFNLKETNK